MLTVTARHLAGVAALFAAFVALVACTTSPTPRGTAYQGASPTGDRRSQDAPYYLGSDPDRPRGARSGGSP
jgi:hypothetical protein